MLQLVVLRQRAPLHVSARERAPVCSVRNVSIFSEDLPDQKALGYRRACFNKFVPTKPSN
jgi:hypothetical protein